MPSLHDITAYHVDYADVVGTAAKSDAPRTSAWLMVAGINSVAAYIEEVH